MTQKTILIRKYENRRLYDVTNSRYVNLDDVARILQNGDDVRVVDASSGEDITRLILTQIIVEAAKTPESAFPLDVLRNMVVASGRASQESALRYMKAMMDMYQNTYRAMAPPLNPFDFMNAAQASAAGAEPNATANGTAARNPEVAAMQQKIAELEKIVSAMAPGRAQRKAKPRAKKPARTRR